MCVFAKHNFKDPPFGKNGFSKLPDAIYMEPYLQKSMTTFHYALNAKVFCYWVIRNYQWVPDLSVAKTEII
jgi:hypothetical protein